MKYTNLEYQSKCLNRLANRAYRVGGLETMQKSIERATDKIYRVLDTVYGRLPEVTRQAHNVRCTL